jgi:hypothetical protein
MMNPETSMPEQKRTEQKILTSAEIGAQFSAQLEISRMMGWNDFSAWSEKYGQAFRDLINDEPEFAGRIMIEGIDEEASVELFQDIIARLEKMALHS